MSEDGGTRVKFGWATSLEPVYRRARPLAPPSPYALAHAHAGPARDPKQFVEAMQCQLKEAVAQLCRRRGRPFDARPCAGPLSLSTVDGASGRSTCRVW